MLNYRQILISALFLGNVSLTQSSVCRMNNPIKRTYYRLSPVENFHHSIAQSFDGYRMCFYKDDKEFCKYNEFFKIVAPTKDQVKIFILNIYEAQIQLTNEEKETLNKGLSVNQ